MDSFDNTRIVVVAGGKVNVGNNPLTTEVLFENSDAWENGPNSPYDFYGSINVVVEDFGSSLVIAGGYSSSLTSILQFQCHSRYVRRSKRDAHCQANL